MLAQFVVAVDQGNISSTLTSTILEDLSIGTNEINTGTQLLLAGNVLFELPFNLLLQHVRLLHLVILVLFHQCTHVSSDRPEPIPSSRPR